MNIPGAARQLIDEHRAQLHASGIDDAMIEAAGLHTVRDGEIAEILGWQPRAFSWGSGLAIPFSEADGGQNGYARVRMDHPREIKGKPARYESPKGKMNRAYFPPGIHGVLSNPAVPLLIVEGEKKALAAQANGFNCLGLVGVFGFQEKRKQTDAGRKYGKRELIADLKAVAWQGRRVVIVFDSDRATNRMVRLAECLTAMGAQVRIGILPELPGANKTGLDDFLAAMGDNAPAELQRLIDAAEAAEAPSPPTATEWAVMFLEDRCTRPDGRTLVWHHDQFHVWECHRYRVYSDSEFSAIIMAWLLEQQHPKPRRWLVREIVAQLQALTRLPFDLDAPVLIKKRPCSAKHLIALNNCILDVDALLSGAERVSRPHTPLLFSAVVLPYEYDPDTDCPMWRAFLDETFEEDEERIALWQEWCGCNLVPDCSFQKFMLGVGEGANGKGVCTDVQEAMLGAENVSHVPLEQFGQRFALWATVGKLANIISEVGELGRAGEGTFKRFTGGDGVDIDRKNLPALLQYRPTARVTIMCNTRPRWLDRTNGIWRRLLYLPFRVSIPEERQDRRLAKRIIDTELSGVFCWSLAGLTRLREQGRFTVPDLSREEIVEYRAEANPARAFLTEECVVAAGCELPNSDLYRTYRKWCVDRNYRPLNAVHFGRELRRQFPKVQRFKNSVNGREERHLAGIACALAMDPANYWRSPTPGRRAGYGNDDELAQ